MQLFENGILRGEQIKSIREAKCLKILINSGEGLFKNNEFMQSAHELLRSGGSLYLLVVDENSQYVDDISDAYKYFYQEHPILSISDYRFSKIKSRDDVVFDIKKTIDALEPLHKYKERVFVRSWISTFRCSMFIWGGNDDELIDGHLVKKIKSGNCWINIALPPFGSDVLPAIYASNNDGKIFHRAQIHYDYIWNKSIVRSL